MCIVSREKNLRVPVRLLEIPRSLNKLLEVKITCPVFLVLSFRFVTFLLL